MVFSKGSFASIQTIVSFVGFHPLCDDPVPGATPRMSSTVSDLMVRSTHRSGAGLIGGTGRTLAPTRESRRISLSVLPQGARMEARSRSVAELPWRLGVGALAVAAPVG